MSLDSAITSLVSRLETVTKRLESVEKQLSSGGAPAPAASASSDSGEGDSPAVQDFDALISQHIQRFVEISKGLGADDVSKQADLVHQAVLKERDLIKIASVSKKPSDDVFQKLFQPILDLVTQIVAIKDQGRTSKFFNNLSTVGEGIAALGWVTVSPTPGPYVADMRGGAEFYSNRILKDFKGKDQNQVDWVTSFVDFLKELQTYIKKHHTTGLTWNPRGGDASSASVGSSAPAASSGAAVPPPPGPAPPPPAPVVETGGKGGAAPDMSGVFAALSKGEAVTSGLRKVTSDMKTKNRTDQVSVVKADAIKTSTPSRATKTQETVKPPKFSLEGTKWLVEHQIGNKSIVISETEPKQTVYIYKCKDSVIQIKGKVNAITLDDCFKTAVVFETAIASFEVVNSKSVEVQILNKVPSVAVDKTSGLQLYLSKEALGVEVVSSKSDSMNILLPTADGDFDEKAVPEQYKTVIRNGALVTETVEHV